VSSFDVALLAWGAITPTIHLLTLQLWIRSSGRHVVDAQAALDWIHLYAKIDISSRDSMFVT
jgi:hypothetical protein